MRSLAVLLFSVAVYTHAFSQNDGIELYAGVSGSMLRGDVNDVSRRNSVYGGFLFIIPVSESFFCLKAGLGYSGRGAQIDGQNIKLNYAELPLLLSLGSKKIDFFIGPQMSFLIGFNNDALDKTRDFGLKYGIGAALSEHVFARAFFYHGFTNLVDQSNATLTNRYISLAIGYRFGSPDKE